MSVQHAADLEQNQGGQREHRQHLVQHGEQARHHKRQQHADRDQAKSQYEQRISNRRFDLAADLVLVLQQVRQVRHYLRQHAGFFAYADHADVKVAEQTRLVL